MATYGDLFRYADRTDCMLMGGGTLAALVGGLSAPAFALLLGGVYNDLSTSEDVAEAGAKYGRIYGYVAIGLAVTCFLQVALFTIASERQMLRLRQAYLQAVLRQEIGWFDTIKSGELTASVAEHTVAIREGLGEKLGLLFFYASTTVGGVIVGFVISWKMTLVILAVTPLLAFGAYIGSVHEEDATNGGLGAYTVAGGIAEEAFTMIRTVASFGLETRVAAKYDAQLDEARDAGIKKSMVQGIGMGASFFFYFLTYGLGFWYGTQLVFDSADAAAAAFPPSTSVNPLCVFDPSNPTLITPEQSTALGCVNLNDEAFAFSSDADVCACTVCDCGCTVSGDCVTGGDVLTVFFSIVLAAFAIGQGSPYRAALSQAKASMGKILEIVDRKPTIEVNSGSKQVANMTGDIVLEKVAFSYPSRPDQPVFDGIDLVIEGGKTTALVGGSGCGKSSVVNLILRFYDPSSGRVLVGGHDLTEIDLAHWRESIGYVGQDPVLFGASIHDNIAFGSSSSSQACGREQVKAAAELASALEFVNALPQGFDTPLGGGKATQLSGGERQRLSIARAIVQERDLLILDEATSALDNASERAVQQALDRYLNERSRRSTTIMIAHRLSTVRRCDKIVVLGQGGVVLEQGSHDELMAIPNGNYLALVQAANRSQEGEEEGGEEAAPSGQDPPEQAEAEEKTLDDLIESDLHLSARMGSLSTLLSASNLASHRSSSKLPGRTIDRPPRKRKRDLVREFLKSKKPAQKKKEKAERAPAPISRVFEFTENERWLYIAAVLGAVLNGATWPLFSILFAGISTVFYLPTQSEVEADVRLFCFYIIGFAVGVGVVYFVDVYCFGIIGERMTCRLRKTVFRSIIRQEIGFFDDRKNTVGSLSGRLATESALVKAGIADKLGLVVRSAATAGTGLAIAFIYGWELALVMLAVLPMLFFAGAVTTAASGGLAKQDEEALAEANNVMSETIAGIRTVTAFSMGPRVVELYARLLDGPMRAGVKKGLVSGAGYGFSQGIIFAMYAVSFTVGALLMDRQPERYTLQTLLTVLFAIAFMGFGLGNAVALSPDVGKSKNALGNVLELIDRTSKIDPLGEDGRDMSRDGDPEDSIVLSHVDFAYPSRPEVQVLRDLNLTIAKGSTVAFVGASGSSKSTVVSLLARWYDPGSGSVKMFGNDLAKTSVRSVRSRIGLVSQEPMLFSGTIFENIAMGVPEGEVVTEGAVVAAAKAANAHDFIEGFPDGYLTDCGARGAQLSTGQKQRVCIARSLVSQGRDVLLLDEATSALDNQSERIVQAALDQVLAGSQASRTKIVIAHRLSTICGADQIFVFDHGKIVEHGNHQGLLRNKESVYSKLWFAQR